MTKLERFIAYASTQPASKVMARYNLKREEIYPTLRVLRKLGAVPPHEEAARYRKIGKKLAAVNAAKRASQANGATAH